jgi:hypothetical protein
MLTAGQKSAITKGPNGLKAAGLKAAATKRKKMNKAHDAMLAALRAVAPYVPVEFQGQVITAINLAVAAK